MMKVSNKCIEVIKHYESLHDGDLSKIGLQPKKDPVCIWTVGYGHALVDKTSKKFLRGEVDKVKAYSMYPNLSVAEAESMLKADIDNFTFELIQVCSSNGIFLLQRQLDALVSFTFNVGINTFLKSTMFQRLKKGDMNVGNEFRRYKFSKGQLLAGLICRRETEKTLYEKDVVTFYIYDKVAKTTKKI